MENNHISNPGSLRYCVNIFSGNSIYYSGKVLSKHQIGFILTRHVKCNMTNLYWQECYLCIRKFYPDHKIIIVDDNSDPNFVDGKNIILTNCEIIKSEFPGRGELLAYYYFHKTHPFEKAVIIHDSVFFQQYVDFTKITTVKFFLEFLHHWNMPEDEKLLLSCLKNKDSLLELHDRRENWKGCFGVISVITYDFLHSLVENYELFNLLDVVVNRQKRQCLERVFSVICNDTDKLLRYSPSLYGDHFFYILDYMYKEPFEKCYNQEFHDKFANKTFHYSFFDYLREKDEVLYKFPFIKIMTGR